MEKTENLVPYHFTPIQNLLPIDISRRMEFTHFVMDTTNANINFVKNIPFTDESTSTPKTFESGKIDTSGIPKIHMSSKKHTFNMT